LKSKIVHKISALLYFLLIVFAAIQANAANQDGNLEFVENKGQWNNDILFRCILSTQDIQIKKNSVNFYLFDEKSWQDVAKHPAKSERKLEYVIPAHAVYLKYIGSNPLSTISAKNEFSHHYNYFLGSDKNKWKSNVKSFKNVVISNLYNNIDIELYSENKTLKYDITLKPGARISDLKFIYEGAVSIKKDYGELVVETSVGNIIEKRPFAYQIIDNKLVQIDVEYKIDGNTISFEAPNSFDSAYNLIIDPKLIFSTYSGSSVDNFGFTATYDQSGHLYSGGIAMEPTDPPDGTYPVTAGAFQTVWKGGDVTYLGSGQVIMPCDMSISKYSPDGTTLLYATYLGGSANEYPHSLVVDKKGQLIVFGTTKSADYPFTQNAFDTSLNGAHDIVITVFDSSGSNLVGSTYIGGSLDDGINNDVLRYFYADDFRGDVIADDSLNIYVASASYSNDFPYTANAYQKQLKGWQDGVLMKFNPDLSQLIWSTYLGGDDNDAIFSVDLGQDSNIYVSGTTNSYTFPTSPNAYKSTFNGGLTDGFAAVISKDGSKIVNATYIGTSEKDFVYSLELDKSGNIFVVGVSEGAMPIKGNVYQNLDGKQFLCKFDKSLSNLLVSTVFGSGKRPQPDITVNAFLVDDCNRIYVSGWGGTTFGMWSGNTRDMPLTSDAIQNTTDGEDFYLILFNKDATGLLYATYFGGNQTADHVDGGTSRFDKNGIVYQSVCSSCPSFRSPPSQVSDFPTTTGSFSEKNPSPRCSNAAFKFDFRIENAKFEYDYDTCSSLFRFRNKTENAFTYLWIFPDGDTSTLENPRKVIGRNYHKDSVTLIVEFGTNCADTAKQILLFPDDEKELKVPNVFTPNADKINDFYTVEGISFCDKVDVYIYNRWGQLMFESKRPNFKWDGKDQKGLDAVEGVYFIILDINKATGGLIHHHGTVTLIRGD